MKKNVSNNYLAEMAFCRPILILLLLLYHAFIIYIGEWSAPFGFVPNEYYAWLARLSYSFMLPMFVFMSGYIWGWQCHTRGSKESLKELFNRKFVRLYLPCLFFGILYIALLGDGEASLFRNIYQIVMGVGHLWFLPMLFLCFMTCWFLVQIKVPSSYVFVGCVVLSVFSAIPQVPQRIADTLLYFQFFYGGVIVSQQRVFLEQKANLSLIVPLWVLFLVVFVLLSVLSDHVDSIVLWTSLMDDILLVACRILYAWLGLISLYLTALYICREHQLPQLYIKVGKYCMGIYIFQQFILKILYYHTDFMVNIYPLFVPWIALGISLFFSILLTFMFKKTRL